MIAHAHALVATLEAQRWLTMAAWLVAVATHFCTSSGSYGPFSYTCFLKTSANTSTWALAHLTKAVNVYYQLGIRH